MEGKKQHCLMSKLTALGNGQKQLSNCRRQDECGCDKGENLAIFAAAAAADENQCKQMMCINSYGSIVGQTRKTSGGDENNNGERKKKKRGQVLEDGEKRDCPADDFSGAGAPTVADIIGSFGCFQFLVLLFSGLREGAVGYDAVIMSVILQPEWDFRCADPVPAGSHLSSWSNNASNLNVTEENFHCFRSLNGRVLVDEVSGEPQSCQSWLFPHASGGGTSLVAEWSLVCHRHWLVAAIECAYFLGLVTGNLVWGYYADKVGRRRAYLLAHTLALLFGWLAIFMPTMELFAICRFFCAFGSIGYNIIYSIQVEIIGTKHRSFSTTLNHLGWGIGVISVPFVARAFDDYRFIIAVGPMLTLFMFPWAFWLPESSRWLMANEQPQLARHELIRAAKFNGKLHDDELEEKIFNMNNKIVMEKRKNSNDDDAVSQYSILFRNPILVRDTLLLSCASFTGHLFYYVLTINFGYIKNLSQEANFITSGAGEWFSVIAGALLLRICSRKFCMSLCLATTSLSFAFQALIDIGLLPHLDTEIIITANNTVGTLSSLLLIFVTLIVNQEVYPTVIRQTGSSIVNTIGESGSTIAPLLIQFARIVGPWRADLLYSLMCLLASVGVQFVTKTDGMELKDT